MIEIYINAQKSSVFANFLIKRCFETNQTSVKKFQDFPAIQILREIKFAASKSAILSVLAAQKLGIFNDFKCGIFPKIKIQGLQIDQNYRF